MHEKQVAESEQSNKLSQQLAVSQSAYLAGRAKLDQEKLEQTQALALKYAQESESQRIALKQACYINSTMDENAKIALETARAETSHVNHELAHNIDAMNHVVVGCNTELFSARQSASDYLHAEKKCASTCEIKMNSAFQYAKGFESEHNRQIVPFGALEN